MRFVTGFSNTGDIEATGVFRPVQRENCVAMADLLAGSAAAIGALEQERGDPEAQAFLLRQCLDDRDVGLASDLMTRAEMDKRFGKG
eukprot:4918696-Lingulodinium_polyedra.AAC.1